MVSNELELVETKKLIKEVSTELTKKKKKFKIPQIGVLIETPAAALISESLGKHCDFFAIGTNDLTMYTLATDRGDEEVANIYDPTHPSVLKLINLTTMSAHNNNIPVSICGEMAGDTLFTQILVGLNITSLSMGISSILKIKQFLSNISFEEAKKISNEILKDHDNVLIKNKLDNYRNYISNKIKLGET